MRDHRQVDKGSQVVDGRQSSTYQAEKPGNEMDEIGFS